MPSPLVPFETCRAPRGMVCAVDHLAAGAGLAMLRAGGSAADAAVAASAVLAVTTQHMCGMGGDLFALVSIRDAAMPAALNASGRAGSGADPERLRAAGHTQMPFRDNIHVTPVPGCVDGWLALHERFGRLALADVLEPARSYAAKGFPASPLLAAAVALVAKLPDAADYVGHGRRVEVGDVVRRPGVARALDAIVAHGRSGFYEGEFGEGLLALGRGEYTAHDLGTVQADWVEPIAVDAWNRRVWTIPPNSQGYLTLAGAWIASGLDLPGDPDDVRWAHLTIEAARQAAFDRLDVLHEHAGGPGLVAPERLAPRRAAISPDGAARLGRPDPAQRPGGTIYLCAVDEDGMGVSLIQSNASGWGSHVIEPNTRIFLQNRGVGFSLQPGHPAEYGPGRRPPHTLSPALVTSPSGALDMVIGTMGGDGQPQTLLQLLARLLHAGQSPAEAMAAGRWVLTGGATGFDTWVDRGRVRVAVEGHAPASWDDGLRTLGHDAMRVDAFSHQFGHAHVIRVEDGRLAGAADPRARTGAAVGY
ncbi:MAG: gamma-glutamyltranspeptidase / glutathione hydrolase [Acidimicrobiaceae bacterium]|nr:gamma-glutamyltranspeptidase / glutathione hydrolase [Acidimicrobiaceae bacterium]